MVLAYNALSVGVGDWGGGATFTLNVLRHLPDALPDARVVAFVRAGEDRIPHASNLDVRRIGIRTTTGRVAAEALRLPFELRRVSADGLSSPNESLPVRPPCPVVV